MDIVVVLPDLTGGGAERLHLDLANDWVRRGHNVDFFLMRKQGELLSIFPSEVGIVDLNTSKLSRMVIPLSKHIKNKNPDIILSAMWPLTSITVLSWILSGRKGKLFLSDHIVLSIESEKNINVPLYLLRIIIRSTYRYANGIIAVSKGVKKDLCRIGSLAKEKVNVIYNPVSGKNLLNYDTALFRKRLWGTTSDYNILSVGSLKEQKDHESLIKAFSLFPKDINAKLIILGDGPLRLHLKDLIIRLKLQDKVCLHGFVEDPYPWYVSADLFVLSSQWEGFGNVIVEALECGVPIVSTDCLSGPSEILENGRYGKLVPMGSPKLLSEAMAGSLLQPHNRTKLMKRAQDFSVSRISDQYLNFFSRLER